jgi:hypothetical protein
MGDTTEDADPRPWEQPGQWRRDGLPHRGRMLEVLASVAAVTAGLGWVFWIPAPVGVVLGALVWLLARRDRRLMDAGVMDPAGRGPTENASVGAAAAVCVGLMPALVLCWWGWRLLLARTGGGIPWPR